MTDVSPDRRVAVAVAVCAAAVSAVVVVALVLFYAVEVTKPLPHVFGPISDIGTVGWDLLAAPLLWGVGAALGGRGLRILSGVAAALSIAGAANSMLLVARVMPAAASWGLTVAVLLVQCVWLFVASRRMRATPGWDGRLAGLGRAMAVAQALGAVLVCGSFLFGWGSPIQVVVMIVGGVPGLLGWILWPVWFALLATDLRRVPTSEPVLIRE